jgi:hypothetical protein
MTACIKLTLDAAAAVAIAMRKQKGVLARSDGGSEYGEILVPNSAIVGMC